jgi:hypothetical protein
MRRFDISVGLLSLAAISSSAGYAVRRERFHDTDLPALYQRINTESFNGALPRADVHWDTLLGRYGETVARPNWAEIRIDRATVTDDRELLEVMEHESCRAYVGTLNVKEDDHGAEWQACMKRFTK